MQELSLYHAELSPCAHKVRIALEDRKIPFESHQIDLMQKENLRPDYLKLNPKGLVPTLVHGDDVVTESTVICEYLEDVVEDRPLMPSSPSGRARVRYWTKWVDEQLHPNTMPLLFGGLARHVWLRKSEEEREKLLRQIPDPNRRARQTRLIEHGLDAPDVEPALKVWVQTFGKIEEQLAQSEWLAGNTYTLAECALLPYIFIMEYLNVEGVFTQYANLKNWMDRCKARPSFDASVKPYVPEQRWKMISAVTARTGPLISAKLNQMAA